MGNSAIVWWELCGPELSGNLRDFEENIDIPKVGEVFMHHESSESFQNIYYSDLRKAVQRFTCHQNLGRCQ